MAEAHRTLVKSPPELWAEISDADSLARHLGAFGEIQITRAEPETTVAWEGDRVRGTVELAPAGWGTKVTVTADEIEPEPEPEAVVPPAPESAQPDPDPEPEPEPIAAAPEPEAPPAPRPRFWARVFGRRRPAPVAVEPEPEPVAAVPEPVAAEPEPEPVAVAPEPEPAVDAAILEETLGSLGSAHHRPFSRG